MLTRGFAASRPLALPGAMQRPVWLVDVACIVGLAILYLAAARLGLALAFLHSSASPVWPPTGIALAALLLRGPRLWPGVTLGAFAANLLTSGDWMTSAGIALGNTLEAVVGSALVRRHARGVAAFDRPRSFFHFVALGALASPLLSALIGVTSLCLGGLAAWTDFARISWTWWLGDAMGALIVAPPLVLLGRAPRWRTTWSLHALALVCCVFAVSVLIFWGHIPGTSRTAPLAILCLPCLVWAAFRFEQRGAAATGLIIAAVAVSGTARGYGPFSTATPNSSLLFLQTFLGTVMVTTLALATVVAERRRVADKLRARVRARLSASQLNLAKAQALAHLGSWDWEIDSDRLRWSDELCRIYGMQPSTAVLDYATFLARVHPEDRGLVDAVIRRAQSTGAAFEFEHRILRPDGSMRWLHGRGDVRQRDGVAIGMSGSALDITEHKLIEMERRRLEIELLDVSQREQVRLGQDLHEDLGQLLTGAALLAKTLEGTFDGHALAAASTVGELRTLLDLAVVKTRSLARGLPEALVLGEGLPCALQDLAADTERRFNICCKLAVGPGRWSCGQQSTMHLYRIAQDATNNAIRHGNAAKILISLATAGGGLTLAIWDDGAGYDPHDVVDHQGLRLMRYRAELLGGSLEISSVPGGTTVLCSLGRQ